MNILFLAAGLGSRLAPVTLKFPKPCVPFLNVPLGLFQFRFIHQKNSDTLVANTFHLPEQIHSLFNNPVYHTQNFLFSDEKSRILGSAGGLKFAAKHFRQNEPVLMMNADEIYFPKDTQFVHKALAQHHKNGSLATLICMEHPEAGNKFGAIWCKGSQVLDIGKSSADPSLKPLHYIGMIILDPKVLSLIPDNIETNIFYDVLIHQLQKSQVEVYKIDADWFETGNPEDYFQATSWAMQNLKPETMSFINEYDPSRIIKNQNGISLISNSIQMDESKLFGFNVISKSTNPKSLESLGRIENSVLFESEILNRDYFAPIKES